MFNSNKTTWIGIVFLVLQFGALTVSAIIGCAAEANFQTCKEIQVKLLQGCGPVDYSCQCNAQKLIYQCYNLCPEYAIDANEQSRIATGICAAVPTTSIAPLPSARPPTQTPTYVAPATTSTTVPTSTQSVKSSMAIYTSPNAYMGVGFMVVAFFIHF